LIEIRTSGLSAEVDTLIEVYEADEDDIIVSSDDVARRNLSSLADVFFIENIEYAVDVSNIDSVPGFFELHIAEVNPDDDRWRASVLQAVRTAHELKQSNFVGADEGFEALVDWVKARDSDYAEELLVTIEESMNVSSSGARTSSRLPELTMGSRLTVQVDEEQEIRFELSPHIGLVEIRTMHLSSDADTTLELYKLGSDVPLVFSDDIGHEYFSIIDTYIDESTDYSLKVENLSSDPGWFELSVVEMDPSHERWRESVLRSLQLAASAKLSGSIRTIEAYESLLSWVRERDSDLAKEVSEQIEASLSLSRLSGLTLSERPELSVGRPYMFQSGGDDSGKVDLELHHGLVNIYTSNPTSDVDTVLSIANLDTETLIAENDDSGLAFLSSLQSVFLSGDSSYEIELSNIADEFGWFEFMVESIEPTDDAWTPGIVEYANSMVDGSSKASPVEVAEFIEWVRQQKPELVDTVTGILDADVPEVD